MFYYKAKDEDFARSYYLMDNSILPELVKRLC